MKVRINSNVVGEIFHCFSRAPGSAVESIDIGPEHGTRMVQCK